MEAERGDDSGKRRKMNDKKNGSSRAGSRGPPRDVVPIEQVLAASDVLRERLASLGATRPSYVIEKQLKTSDVHPNQARLLFSCKSEPLALCPLAACFTELEARRVGDKGAGLLVTALDRGGRSYDLTCKYLASNHGYRFITGWKTFLEANGLLLDGEGSFQRDVHVELWAFRSQALPNRLVDVEEEKKKKKKKIHEETGHPDGALGLLLLHYEYAFEHGQDDREEEGMVNEAPMMLAAAQQVTKQEDLLAGAGTEQREAAASWAMTKDEIVAKFGEKMANAAIGMNLLRVGR